MEKEIIVSQNAPEIVCGMLVAFIATVINLIYRIIEVQRLGIIRANDLILQSINYARDSSRYFVAILILCISIAICTFVAIYTISAIKSKLIITDKRVYGTVGLNKRIDLPLDSITAVGKGIPKSLQITTPSGRLSFIGLLNADQIYTELNTLLLNRQSNLVNEAVSNSSSLGTISNADEIRKYRELANQGIISEEEFQEVKKQLLNK